MAKQSDFTAEEWKTLGAAPLMAGLYVSLSQASGLVGLAKESFAVVKEVVGATDSPNDLVKAIAEGVRSGGRPEMPSMPRDKEQAQQVLLDGLKKAMAAAGKSPADAAAYGQWVFAAAQKAAEAAKEGGFLGIGGTAVTEAEKAALDTLKSLLGVKA
jgi:hypothetical protein